MKRLFFAAMLLIGLMALSSCGGGSGSGDDKLSNDTKSKIETSYQVLEESERTALTTLLKNTDNTDVQNVMDSVVAGSEGGLTSANMESARADADARANPFADDPTKYALYEDAVDAMAALKAASSELFSALTALFESMDTEEFDAVVDVIEDAQEVGYAAFDALMDTELDDIVADATGDSGDSGDSGDTPTGVSGVAVDPYIVGAVFCVDENTNEMCDSDEPVSTASDSTGRFTFEEEPADGAYILIKADTTGLHNGIPYRMDELGALYSDGELVVSPLTTMNAEGLTAAQLVEMFQKVGLNGVTEEGVLSDPLSGILDGDTSAAKLDTLRSFLATYITLQIIAGSETLEELEVPEIYSNVMANGEIYDILSTVAGFLNSALSEDSITAIETDMGAGITAGGLPAISFADVISISVAIADKLAVLGYQTCNSTNGTEEEKVTAALTAVNTFVTTKTINSMIADLAPLFYFARVDSQLTDLQKAALASDDSYQTMTNCQSKSFILDDNGDPVCYTNQYDDLEQQ